MFYAIGEKSGQPLNTFEAMREKIEAAGFVNVQENVSKVPFGPWAQHPVYKEAGRFNLQQLLTTLEGYVERLYPCLMLIVNYYRYAIFLLTKFGIPEPWSAEEVQNMLTQVKIEICRIRRSMATLSPRGAQKPLDK